MPLNRLRTNRNWVLLLHPRAVLRLNVSSIRTTVDRARWKARFSMLGTPPLAPGKAAPTVASSRACCGSWRSASTAHTVHKRRLRRARRRRKRRRKRRRRSQHLRAPRRPPLRLTRTMTASGPRRATKSSGRPAPWPGFDLRPPPTEEVSQVPGLLGGVSLLGRRAGVLRAEGLRGRTG